MSDSTPSLSQIMPLLNPIYPEQYHQLFMKIKLKIQAKQYTRELNDMIEKLLVFGESNYTCWIAKKRIVEAGQIPIKQEDEYSQELLVDNLKNFQIWDYRNYVFQTTKDSEKQYALMDEILQISPKNYHLWSNRVRVVDYQKNYEEQIKKTEKYIHRDLFNNSAWSYRHYCYRKAYEKQKNDHHDQIKWTLYQITKNIVNQAAWNYLRGYFPSFNLKLFKNTSKQSHHLLSFSDYPQIQETCKQIINDTEQTGTSKAHALITLLVINSQHQDRKQYAIQNCEYLIELQPLRKNYYQWLKSAL